MNGRALHGSIPAIVMLALASHCSAENLAATQPGNGSVGGAIGASYFSADADYSAGAQPRFAFFGSFRYAFTPWLRAQFTPGFTWSAYDHDEPIPFRDLNFPADSNKADVLTLVAPATLQLQYMVTRGLWLYHLGLGGGGYRVWVENRRKVLEDPTTFRLHRGIYPGLAAEVGASHFFKEHPSVAVEWTVGSDWIFAQRDEQFPSGFNSFIFLNHVRFGVSYFFSLKRAAPKSPEPLPGP